MTGISQAKLGSLIFRAGLLVDAERRNDEMGRVAMEYGAKQFEIGRTEAQKIAMQAVSALDSEVSRLRTALAMIADMSKTGLYGDIARQALNGDKNDNTNSDWYKNHWE